MSGWLLRFEEGVKALGIAMPHERTTAGLQLYLDVLQLWNRKINLTSVRGANEIAVTHFVDSLAVLLGLPPDTRTLLDAGSGAGFPGMVLALARPELTVTLCESNSKKCAFLRTVQRELGLQNVLVVASRLHRLTGPFDAAVSRATWDMAEWLSIGRELVGPSGVVVGMEGAKERDLPKGGRRIVYTLHGATRALVVC